jgi:hypothetical protein
MREVDAPALTEWLYYSADHRWAADCLGEAARTAGTADGSM